jgi:hypothetical protein
MRRLSAGEHGVLTDAFVDLENHLEISRWHADRARRDGGQREASSELDQARSDLDELIKLAAELDVVLARLVRATDKETTPRSKAPVLARDDQRRRRQPAA